jgi:hypothetical protein
LQQQHNGKVTASVRTIERVMKSVSRRRRPRIPQATVTARTAGTSYLTRGKGHASGTRALEGRRATARAARLTASAAGNWQGGWRREQTHHVVRKIVQKREIGRECVVYVEEKNPQPLPSCAACVLNLAIV